ncbi:MAG: 16S rRNA (cytidine(1402)-2'-O)-methyltransferase [Candidatus Hydrogenedentes bacterium]|nr:16S rRNA (cytidine(1402)-2'-O)-methyltransferase [Candidatus Hydrogenedentota bacterium]
MATLYVIATPIGNLEDLSYRAVRILGELENLACEDTRVTRKIFEKHELHRPRTIFSYHEHNEEQGCQRILGLLNSGQDVGLCSDGGCPGVSDPGYRILSACHDGGHHIEVIPGASAVTTALLASGLSTSSFTFKGFPPRKSGARQRFLLEEAELPHTLILFESPHRIEKLLEDVLAALGDRLVAVCVELTKKFERVHRGYCSAVLDELRGKPIKGEITVVIAGNHAKFRRDEEDAADGPSATEF